MSKRRTQHFSDLKHGNHNCKDLQADYDNGHNVIFSVFEYVNISEGMSHFKQKQLRLREQHYINSTANLYNLRNVRMEPLSEINSVEWIKEMQDIINQFIPRRVSNDYQTRRWPA